MGRAWVLKTETKGTGAHMVPLERALQRAYTPEPLFVPKKARPQPKQPPEPKSPPRFRVDDVMTRQHLLEHGSVRAAVEALKEVRSIVDVNVHVWQEDRKRWRPLTLADTRALLDLARSSANAGSNRPRGR